MTWFWVGKNGIPDFQCFFKNSKWRPAAILNLTSKVKFDSRNEIRRSKTIGNHMLHYFVLLKWAGYDIFWVFQDGRRRPSWIFKTPYIFSLGPLFCSIKMFWAIKTKIDMVLGWNYCDSWFLVFFGNPIWPPAAILKNEILIASLAKSYFLVPKSICAKENICTIIWSQTPLFWS